MNYKIKNLIYISILIIAIILTVCAYGRDEKELSKEKELQTPISWEYVSSSGLESIHKTRIPRGWIYRYKMYSYISICFVPDNQ